MKSLLSSRLFSTDFAALILRLTLGGLFIYHGYDKLINYDMYLGMSKSIIGLGAKTEFNLVIFAEFFCGIFVAAGFFYPAYRNPNFYYYGCCLFHCTCYRCFSDEGISLYFFTALFTGFYFRQWQIFGGQVVASKVTFDFCQRILQFCSKY